MKKATLAFFIPLFLLVTSCKKYLDVKSNSSLSVPTSLQDLQALLDDAQQMNLGVTPAFGQASSDEYFLPDATYNGFDDIVRKNTYTWQPFEYNFNLSDWSKAYLAIYNTNVCLEQLEKIDPNTNQVLWNNVKGSALFYRSYFFLDLSWEYSKAYDKNTSNSDLGIVLRQTSDINRPSQRSTVEESYTKILSDLSTSLPLLPNTATHSTRPSKSAAYGLLARTYLSMREYDSAFKYSDLSLQIKNELIDHNGDQDLASDISGFTPFSRFNKETVYYSEMSANFGSHFILYGKTDTLLYNSYDENDLRKYSFFTFYDGGQIFKGMYSQNIFNYFTGITTAEMYLTRAECNVRMNNVQAGVDDLNYLLRKRWKTGTYQDILVSDPTEILDIVLSERKKELVMRGLRWMDIKRLNKEGRNIVLKREINGSSYTLQSNSSWYALPLPTDLVRTSGIEQN